MHTKLAIGTVQFGLNYGISNTAGQVSLAEIDRIFDYAVSKGVCYADTAQAYGNSEEVLGQFSGKYPLVFITKLKAAIGSDADIITAFDLSLSRLKVSSVYALLYHDFGSFRDSPGSLKILNDFKEKGQVQKIGFSLYHPEELKYLLDNNIGFDIVQIPYNIFDRRFEPYFETLKQLNVEIHVRSVFLQGIIFMDRDKLSPFFNDFRSKLDLFHQTCARLNVSAGHAALQFVAANNFIDKIVLGIISVEHLKTNLEWLDQEIKPGDTNFNELKEDNLNFIIPSNWKL